MKRLESKYVHSQPARRPLRIFASDPMLARAPGNRITIDIPNELLRPGPQGSRFEVIDYDGVNDCFYPPVDLNHAAILMQGGLEPTESDPRFHQQMVYAVAMRTLENFERALGRRLEFTRGNSRRLRLFPHAFHGANSFYDRDLNAILFGYFRADRKDPGPNLPGQIVFTCLSHDIIVHELTHAVVDRLRRHFLEPSNPDVLAFHEGFSDIIALFQHFTFQEFLRDEIQKTRGDIQKGKRLVELATQFGYATGAGQALRSAIGKPETRLSESVTEVHERGSVLVAAVFDAFFATYQRRIQDLIRIATGGSGTLPQGDLHPDLVNRIAGEASKTAQGVLIKCIRAFDYLPPVDITFGDFLRAHVTADYELFPDDDSGLRGAMIEAFRARGIYPEGVASLAEESLIWQEAPSDIPPLPYERIKLANEISLAASAFSQNPFEEAGEDRNWGGFSSSEERGHKEELAKHLHQYARQNAASLYLDPKKTIMVRGFHTSFRVGINGRLISELIVQFTQEDEDLRTELGGIPFRGGTTIIAGTEGRVRYLIAKPLPSKAIDPAMAHRAGLRLQRQRGYLAASDLRDPELAYGNVNYMKDRAFLRMRLASLHQGVTR
ncbi:MAG: hypothetical protein WAU47_14565 [Desulfobaccales bacterium]